MTEQEIREIIDNNIRTNGREEITGAVANNVLQAMVDYASENITPTFDVSGAISVGQVTTAVNGDKIARYIPSKAISKWDLAYAGSVGGYNIGDIVIHNDEFYVSQANNNTTTPSSASIGWRRLDSGGYILPKATTTTLGGVKVDGSTIIINSDGVISATGGGGGGGYVLPTASYAIKGGVKVDDKTTVMRGEFIEALMAKRETLRIALSPFNTDLTVGDLNGFVATRPFKIVDFKTTASVVPTGSAITTGIKKNGTIITSTLSTINANTNNSVGTTQPVFTNDTFAVGDRLNFYIPTGGIGTTTTGQNLQGIIIIEYLD